MIFQSYFSSPEGRSLSTQSANMWILKISGSKPPKRGGTSGTQDYTNGHKIDFFSPPRKVI